MEKLPEYGECEAAVLSGNATCLQQFIFSQEPAGKEDEECFRYGLLKVVNEIEGI